MTCTLVVHITYNMGNRDLPDIYAHALGPAALGLGHINQANPSCPCYNLYIYIYIYIYIIYLQYILTYNIYFLNIKSLVSSLDVATT